MTTAIPLGLLFVALWIAAAAGSCSARGDATAASIGLTVAFALAFAGWWLA